MARVAMWESAPRKQSIDADVDGKKEGDQAKQGLEYTEQMESLARDIQAFEDRLAGTESPLARMPAVSPSSPPPKLASFGTPAGEGDGRGQGTHQRTDPHADTFSGELQMSSAHASPPTDMLMKPMSKASVSNPPLMAVSNPPLMVCGPRIDPPVFSDRPADISPSNMKNKSSKDTQGTSVEIPECDDQTKAHVAAPRAEFSSAAAPPAPAKSSSADGSDEAENGALESCSVDGKGGGVGIAIHEQEGKIVVTGVKKGSR